jgi:hypothetical protein
MHVAMPRCVPLLALAPIVSGGGAPLPDRGDNPYHDVVPQVEDGRLGLEEPR